MTYEKYLYIQKHEIIYKYRFSVQVITQIYVWNFSRMVTRNFAADCKLNCKHNKGVSIASILKWGDDSGTKHQVCAKVLADI